MTDAIEKWVNAYRAAWESNDSDDIRALFTEDASYLTAPFREPWRGHDEIVAGWLDARDEPGETTFEWRVLAQTDELAFVQGETAYRDDETYSNLWVIALDADGRATSFTEWWMEQPSAT